uniref:40S ribosomal protein S23 n=1 Tax=Haptolina brevifila TaxID=156173 RepID=A0A7S2JK06_9EUKA|mmetsp:Transcript_84416/g.168560  ORF Transcript_84416/g.168560 Transcript_84416/m.168560 type:complete len:151 (+) Transcript_84416:40-492(+)
MGSGKPRGINAARKLRTVRRQNRWAQKAYKKAHLGTQFKCNPFGGSSHCKGIVLEKIGIEAKQPNSAIRKCVRAQLIKNGKKIAAFVPRDGCLNFIDENVSDAPPPLTAVHMLWNTCTIHDYGQEPSISSCNPLVSCDGVIVHCLFYRMC